MVKGPMNRYRFNRGATLSFFGKLLPFGDPDMTEKMRIPQNGWKSNASDDPGIYFVDGHRKIDMVLAFEDSDSEAESEIDEVAPKKKKEPPKKALEKEEPVDPGMLTPTPPGAKRRNSSRALSITIQHLQDKLEIREKRRRARRAFEENVLATGLQIEHEHKNTAFDKKTSFAKIHAPKGVLERNAEILGLVPPVKEFTVTAYISTNKALESVNQFRSKMRSFFDCDTIPPEPNIFSPGFGLDRANKYVVKEHCPTLTHVQRSQVVWQILNRTSYDMDHTDKVGIQRLISKNVYKAAFPIHDGDYSYPTEEENSKRMNERRLLYLEWASLKNWYKKQPLWLIKNYFGVKIGLYFAWLGFYTRMLIIPAIAGVVSVCFGLSTVSTPLNQVSKQMCEDTGTKMCPECDLYCDYWDLSFSCPLSRITYLFDNNITVIFSIFMTVWATTFLELWKRRQSILKWEWDLAEDVDEEEIRPEFEANVKSKRLNPITRKQEAFVSGKEKTIRIAITWGLVLFMLTLVIGAVFCVIIFRMFLIEFMHETTHEAIKSEFMAKYAKLIGTGLAASLNAAVIETSGFFFQIIARKLTDIEHQRTQNDYENSYTFKMFMFQFINYYSSLIYTAFFKGRFFTSPGDAESRQGFITRLKADQCDPAGCLYELCLMLAIYMIARQIASNFMELFWPKFKNWFRFFIYKLTFAKDSKVNMDSYVKDLKRWERDYQLEEIDRLHLFDEYIEMIIQYGFVTLFVAAFPLAPLLALINNIFEIRLDAYKLTTQMRRPLAEQVKDIGVWYSILEAMTYLAVVFNAFIIALTSDFIPRMVYLFVYSDTNSMDGYVDWTLAKFQTSEWGDPNSAEYFGASSAKLPNSTKVDICRYRAFRNEPGTEKDYDTLDTSISRTWLHVFTARLIFIVIFEHFVLVLKVFLAYAIPDSPNNLRVQLQRERQTQKEAQFEQDKQRAQKSAYKRDSDNAGDNARNNNNHQNDDDRDDFEPSVITSRSSAGSFLSRRVSSVTPVQ